MPRIRDEGKFIALQFYTEAWLCGTIISPLGVFQCNCSILSENGRAVVIDPGDECDKILRLLNEQGLTVEQILLTHAHIDHVGAVAELKRHFEAPVALHPADQPTYDLLPMQAQWTGVREPEPFTIDQALASGKR